MADLNHNLVHYYCREDGLLSLASSTSPPPAPPSAATAPIEGTTAAADPTAASTVSNPIFDGTALSSTITATSVPASGPPALVEVVTMLSFCFPDELEKLEALTGTKKLLGVYRALRSQQFLRAAREKLEAKAAKAAELAEQKPVKKVLSKEREEAFLQRLAEDAARRARNKEELQAKALEEEKAKFAPAPSKSKRSAAAAKPAAE